MMINIFKEKKGQTMIELVVAISIILIGVISTLVLTLTTISGGKASKSQVVAVNLVREGIEVAKQARDNNWLKIESNSLLSSQWDNGMKIDDVYTAVAIFSGTPEALTLTYKDPLTFLNDQCINDIHNSCRVYTSRTTGKYAQFDGTVPGGWLTTNYYRVIQTNEICQDNSNQEERMQVSGGSCDTDETKIGIQVVSQVKWLEKSHWESLTFEDHLYNWK